MSNLFSYGLVNLIFMYFWPHVVVDETQYVIYSDYLNYKFNVMYVYEIYFVLNTFCVTDDNFWHMKYTWYDFHDHRQYAD